MAVNLLLTPEIQQAYKRQLLKRFRTDPILNKWASQDGIPANGGVNLMWRRMETIRPVAVASLSWPADAVYTLAAGALLTEGSLNIAATVATWTSTTATVRQYGKHNTGRTQTAQIHLTSDARFGLAA